MQKNLINSKKSSTFAAEFVPKMLYKWDKR
jgi:hypothetical protein